MRLSRFLREHLDLRPLSPKDFSRLKMQETEKDFLVPTDFFQVIFIFV